MLSSVKPHHTSEKDSVKEVNGGLEIPPRGLNIVWGNDPRYWRIPDDDGPAEVIQVSWLEVTGVVSVRELKKYKVSFVVRVKENGFGWNGTPVRVMARIGKKRFKYEMDTLRPGENIIPSTPLEVVAKNIPSDLHFGLYEVWSGKWKGGLEIIKAIIQTSDP